MKRVIGVLGDKLMVRDEEGEFDDNLDLFVDDEGAVVALAKDDQRHPEHGS